jgi:peptidyl-prolyl cis-trans isomerase C
MRTIPRSVGACIAFCLAALPTRAGVGEPVEPAPADRQFRLRAERLLSFLPDIVARWDGGELRARALKQALLPQLDMGLRQSERTGQGEPPTEAMAARARALARETASRLVDQRLLLAQAAKDGILPDRDGAIDRAIAEMRKAEERLGPGRVAENLAYQGVTREEAVKELASQLADQAAFNSWVQTKIIPANQITEAEARQFYETNQTAFRAPETIRVSHILRKVEPNASKKEREAAREEMKTLQKKAKARDADFAELARANSDCPSARDGGDLGFFPKGRMVPAFEAAAWSLKPGELSDVVETPYGFHIIRGGARRPAGTKSFDDVKAKLMSDLKRRKINEAIAHTARRAREAAHVEILIPQE